MPEHPCAPVTLDLAAGGVVGVAGEDAVGLARAVVGQVVTLLSPHDLRVVVRVPDGAAADWSWTSWLPHTDNALPVPVHPRDGARARGPVRLLVLVGAGGLRRAPDVAALLGDAAAAADGPRRDVVVLCVEDDPDRLPVECRATVVTHRTGRPGARAVVRDGGVQRDCVPDGLGAATAARLARDLARLRDATPDPDQGALPQRVGLLELAGLDEVGPRGPDPLAGDPWAALLTERWRRPPGPPALRVMAGTTAAGPWTVDLRADGPHALVAGTTGAGKSELLRTLVAGLALAHRPDEVTFLLVDYKGGTAFAGLEALPHVCGLLTDLDRHTARRTLASLRAELRRRERLLRAAGAGDLDAYDRVPDRPALDPLPRLVLVVDEFRVLAEELPDLLDGLVRVAAVGRSLGVHLVLATQRPAGVVSADMRANLNLRIALRVRDREDSDDVVDSPAAAALPADRPGRAVVRTGGRAPLVVQTALLATAGTDPGVVVRPLRTRPDDPGADDPEPVDDDREALVARLVRACAEAARRTGADDVRPPWLPPLGTRVLLDALPTAGSSSGLVLGLCDVPDEQRREPLVWDPDAGGLAVVGGPASGRTTALRAVVAAAMRAAGDVHVHVVTTSGGLASGGLASGGLASGEPGVRATNAPRSRLGTVVPVADVDRLARLVRRLAEDPPRASRTLLVVDGWDAVADALAGHERGRALDGLLALLRDGGAQGVRLAASGGRSLLTGPVGAVVGTRLLLRSADPTDALVAGLDPAEVPEVMPPGRAVLVARSPDGGRRTLEAQVALLAPDPHPAAQERALARACAESRTAGPGPLRLVPLAQAVALEDLPRAAREPQDVVVGLGGDEARPAVLPLRPGEVVLVAGPAGSGRTTALATVGAAAVRAGRRVRALPDAQDLLDPPVVDGTEARPDDAEGLVVLLDDAEDRPPTVLERAERLLAAGATVVVSATGAQALVAFRGPLAHARRFRTGLLLGALGSGEGEVLGVREAGAQHGPPGRGLLVVRGRAVPVQVARSLPDGAPP